MSLESDMNPTPEKVEQWIRMTTHAAICSVGPQDQPLWNDLTAYLRFKAASASREVSEEDETRAAGIILRELQQGGRIRITDDFAATVARCVLGDFVASGGTS